MRNIVRNQTRNLQRKDQTDITIQCKTNSKNKNKIVNISYKKQKQNR